MGQRGGPTSHPRRYRRRRPACAARASSVARRASSSRSSSAASCSVIHMFEPFQPQRHESPPSSGESAAVRSGAGPRPAGQSGPPHWLVTFWLPNDLLQVGFRTAERSGCARRPAPRGGIPPKLLVVFAVCDQPLQHLLPTAPRPAGDVHCRHHQFVDGMAGSRPRD